MKMSWLLFLSFLFIRNYYVVRLFTHRKGDIINGNKNAESNSCVNVIFYKYKKSKQINKYETAKKCHFYANAKQYFEFLYTSRRRRRHSRWIACAHALWVRTGENIHFENKYNDLLSEILAKPCDLLREHMDRDEEFA